MTDVSDRRRLTFAEVVDRGVVYLIAGLICWLCASTLVMREQLAVMVERSSNDRARVERMEANQAALREEVQAMRGRLR